MPKEVLNSKLENSFGMLSVIFGILSVVLPITLVLGSFSGLIFGILGLIFASIQRKRSKNSWSKAGIWLSIIGIILSIILIIFFISAIADLANELQSSGLLNKNIAE